MYSLWRVAVIFEDHEVITATGVVIRGYSQLVVQDLHTLPRLRLPGARFMGDIPPCRDGFPSIPSARMGAHARGVNASLDLMITVTSSPVDIPDKKYTCPVCTRCHLSHANALRGPAAPAVGGAGTPDRASLLLPVSLPLGYPFGKKREMASESAQRLFSARF